MENNIFYKRLQTKKTKDLEIMFRHPSMYEPKALEAAGYIIDERKKGDFSEPLPIPIISKYSKEDDQVRKLFGTKFFKTFSIREIYSSFAIALAVMAVFDLLSYYQEEEWLDNKWYSNQMIYLFLFIPLLHVIYQKEHTRSNDFIGRCLHILIFIFSIIIIKMIKSWVLYGYFNFPFYENNSWYLTPFMFGVLVIIIEIPFTIIKAILNLFKWRIW